MPTVNVNRIYNGFVNMWWTSQFPNGVTTNGQSLSGAIPMVLFSTSKDWVRTPNFWVLRRARAQLPENNYLFTELRIQDNSFSFNATQQSGGSVLNWSMHRSAALWTPRPDPGFTYSSWDLYSRLADRARNSDFSAPVTIIEGRRTVQMVADLARNLAGTIFDLRRGNLTSAMRRLGLTSSQSQVRRYNRRYGADPTSTAANAWLQLQYGWKPLLNDVKNAAEALAEANLRNGDDATFTVSARTSQERSRIFSNHPIQVSPIANGTVSYTETFSQRAKWRFKRNASDVFGLFGLTNPLEVAWEIIPFSFVADWFIPIGSYLSSQDLPFRTTHVGGSKGFRKRQTWICEPRNVQFGGNPTVSTRGQFNSATFIEVSRTKFTSHPVPTLSDLAVESGLGSTRAISAIALLRQQASRLRR